MNETYHTVLTGAVAGVFAAIALRLMDRYVLDCWERTKQVKAMRRLTEETRTKIFDFAKDDFPEIIGDSDSFSRQNSRGGEYHEFRNKLQRLLDREDSKLSFDQKEELKDVLLRVDGESTDDPERHVQIFEKAESIRWLKLKPTNYEDHIISRDIEFYRRKKLRR